MKTRYKHIHFIEGDEYWDCYTNKDDTRLGYIRHDVKWNLEIFEIDEGCILSASCLRDIANFLEQVEKQNN